MLSLISAMCHKLQQQSIQPFWPHPTCCHTEKNETVGEIFAEQRLSFVKTYVAKKVCFYFYGSWERGKWRNIACLHSCAGIRWFQTSQTCQHHKLIQHHIPHVGERIIQIWGWWLPSKVHFSVDNNDKRTLPADLCLSTFCDREPFITCCKKIRAIYSSSRRAFLDADAGDSGGDHNDHGNDNDDAQKNTPSTAHIVAST